MVDCFVDEGRIAPLSLAWISINGGGAGGVVDGDNIVPAVAALDGGGLKVEGSMCDSPSLSRCCFVKSLGFRERVRHGSPVNF